MRADANALLGPIKEKPMLRSAFICICSGVVFASPEFSFYRAVSPYTLKTTDGELAKSSWRAARVIIPETADASEVSNADLVVYDNNITDPANFTMCQACILALDGDNQVAKANYHPNDPGKYCIRVWDTNVFESSQHCFEHKEDHCTCYRNVKGSDYVTSCDSNRGMIGFYWFIGTLCVFLLACAAYLSLRQQCTCVSFESSNLEQDVRQIEVRSSATFKVTGSDASAFRAAFDSEFSDAKTKIAELEIRMGKAFKKGQKALKQQAEADLKSAKIAIAGIEAKLAAGGQVVRVSLEADLKTLKQKLADLEKKLTSP